MRTIYRRRNDEWSPVGYECPDCAQYFSTDKRLTKHSENCSRINTINKEKEDSNIPVIRIVKDGVTYYRHSNSETLHDNYEDAELEFYTNRKPRPYKQRVKKE